MQAKSPQKPTSNDNSDKVVVYISLPPNPKARRKFSAALLDALGAVSRMNFQIVK